MDSFQVCAWLALADFKNDNRSSRGSSGGSSSSSSSGSRRRSGYNPNQTRGEDGRWVESSTSDQPDANSPSSPDTAVIDFVRANSPSFDPRLFDLNTAIGRSYLRDHQEIAARNANAPKESPKDTSKENTPTGQKKLPKDVEVDDDGRGSTSYIYTTKQYNRLDVNMTPVSPDSTDVEFKINRSLKKSEDISPEESKRISVKIAKIMQYDASRRPDGAQYESSAYTGDSPEYGAVRAYAYEKIGNFTRPAGGSPGGDQYGIVKNGKVIPDTNRLKEAEASAQSDPAQLEKIERNIAEYRNEANKYRRSRK